MWRFVICSEKSKRWIGLSGVLNIFGFICIYLFTFFYLFYYVFDIFVFNRWHWRIPPCSLTMYEFIKQSSLLSKRCTWLFKVFSIRRTERESLKYGTNTHTSALMIRIAKVPSWWWIPRWSRAASLKENLCSTLNATPKWDLLTTSPNNSYFVKRRLTNLHSRRASENLNDYGTLKILFTSLSIKFSKGEFVNFEKKNCILF